MACSPEQARKIAQPDHQRPLTGFFDASTSSCISSLICDGHLPAVPRLPGHCVRPRQGVRMVVEARAAVPAVLLCCSALNHPNHFYQTQSSTAISYICRYYPVSMHELPSVSVAITQEQVQLLYIHLLPTLHLSDLQFHMMLVPFCHTMDYYIFSVVLVSIASLVAYFSVIW